MKEMKSHFTCDGRDLPECLKQIKKNIRETETIYGQRITEKKRKKKGRKHTEEMKGYLTCDGIDLPECQKIYRSKQRERSVLWAQNNEEEGRETNRDEETIYLRWD